MSTETKRIVTDQEKRITILLELLVASNVNADYCATELMGIPLANKFVRHEVKMYFQQLRILNDKLMLSMQRQFDFASADLINELSQFIFDVGWVGAAATPEQRKELIEQMVSTLESKSKHLTAA